jgi:hypothetical protein
VAHSANDTAGIGMNNLSVRVIASEELERREFDTQVTIAKDLKRFRLDRRRVP